MDDLERLREERMKELQANMGEEQKTQQEFEQAEMIIKKFLDKEALARYGNIKAADPSRATQIIGLLAHFAQQGKISKPLTDAEFKELLQQTAPKKRDINIKHS